MCTRVIIKLYIVRKKNTKNTRILESRETCNGTMRASMVRVSYGFRIRLVRCLCCYVAHNIIKITVTDVPCKRRRQILEH